MFYNMIRHDIRWGFLLDVFFCQICVVGKVMMIFKKILHNLGFTLLYTTNINHLMEKMH
jgi:hypothetical protein